jgi:glycosyltransferase involved in cell wall biosynthesis
MKLHILGLPHTQTTNEYSHCAYTGKIKRFSPMLRSVGYDVYHYGVAGADSGATKQIDVLSYDEWMNILKRMARTIWPDRSEEELLSKKDFFQDFVRPNSELYVTFNKNVEYQLIQNYEQGDIICLPFGYAHEDALKKHFGNAIKVETGIGYDHSYQNYRIFESYAWYHYTAGKQNAFYGNDYWFVIPNYYDVTEWKFNQTPERYVAFMGRLIDTKGLGIFVEMARARPDMKFIMCGQGDPTPWLTLPNLEYQEPKHGLERSEFLGNATAFFAGTRYIEPFGGVAVEAQLCGTPVLGSGFACFTETIEHGATGFNCHTLGDFLVGLEVIERGDMIDRNYVRYRAAQLYDMYKVAHQYDSAFQQILDVSKENGWYRPVSYTTHRRRI